VLAGLVALPGCGNDPDLPEPLPPRSVLVFETQPSGGTAGTALADIKVVLKDTRGALVHGGGTVSLRLAAGPEGVTMDALEATMLHGEATFQGLTLTLAGRGYVLEARQDSLRVLSGEFSISAGPPGKVVVALEPIEEAYAGEQLAPFIKVAVQDVYGNSLYQAGGEVTASLVGEGGGTLSGTTTVPVYDGLATFADLSVDRVGQYRLVFRYGTEATVQSRLIRIRPTSAAALRFQVQPTTVGAGASISPAVEVAVVDRFGNIATHASEEVTLALGENPGGDALGGTLKASTAQGVATFADLSVRTVARGYTLQATAGALTPAESAAFDVEP